MWEKISLRMKNICKCEKRSERNDPIIDKCYLSKKESNTKLNKKLENCNNDTIKITNIYNNTNLINSDKKSNAIFDSRDKMSEFDKDRDKSEFNIEYEYSDMAQKFDIKDMIIGKKIGEGAEGIL